MNLHQQQRELETLEQDAAAIAMFVSSLDNGHLQALWIAASNELGLRSQGKPADRKQLH